MDKNVNPKILAVLLKKHLPGETDEPEREEDVRHVAAQELLDAISRKDPDALAAAFANMVEACAPASDESYARGPSFEE